jgi:hypothetical protein
MVVTLVTIDGHDLSHATPKYNILELKWSDYN